MVRSSLGDFPGEAGGDSVPLLYRMAEEPSAGPPRCPGGSVFCQIHFIQSAGRSGRAAPIIHRKVLLPPPLLQKQEHLGEANQSSGPALPSVVVDYPDLITYINTACRCSSHTPHCPILTPLGNLIELPERGRLRVCLLGGNALP